MQAYLRTFWVPKRGSSPAEYEDAAWVGPDGKGSGEMNFQTLAVTLADGASESMLAGRWARQLVEVFGMTKSAACSKEGFITAYREAVSGWDNEVLKYTAGREERNAPIQWYEEPGLVKGAYSTILAVEFNDTQQGHTPCWTAAALGDSCLFQVRGDSLYDSFPKCDSNSFSYQPPLLSSRGSNDEILSRHISTKSNDWESEDRFYLVTDALAEWFLRANEADGRPWEPLRDMETCDAELDFAGWVDERRDLGEMHDDDTTLIRIDIY